jgi:hypothetical protein
MMKCAHTHTHTKLLVNDSGDLIFVVRVDKNYYKLWKNGSSEKLNEVKEICLTARNMMI